MSDTLDEITFLGEATALRRREVAGENVETGIRDLHERYAPLLVGKPEGVYLNQLMRPYHPELGRIEGFADMRLDDFMDRHKKYFKESRTIGTRSTNFLFLLYEDRAYSNRLGHLLTLPEVEIMKRRNAGPDTRKLIKKALAADNLSLAMLQSYEYHPDGGSVIVLRRQ